MAEPWINFVWLDGILFRNSGLISKATLYAFVMIEESLRRHDTPSIDWADWLTIVVH